MEKNNFLAEVTFNIFFLFFAYFSPKLFSFIYINFLNGLQGLFQKIKLLPFLQDWV